ncbi:hypothetical protein RM190_08565 [Paracoccus sp. CPCC 101403]|uniref:Uncharacterized protein n=1 Tax=Paracoccus broussonetiae TaxID=3075834 RepID=A0ABU3ECF1_9RHOB|nr:hypothetical protein [Paracoccus sp. CPCC 101403]MDT1061906.1 hypothetical protein [Paracoccus sp. CPCC 101403]
MPIKVYPWPPVGAIGGEWTSVMPTARLRSLLTGRDQMQASQRRRRMAVLQVSALANGRMGAGYCEMLKDLLEGGIHAVRLQSTPINWWLDELDRRGVIGTSDELRWRTAAGDPLAWRTAAGDPLYWFTGRPLIGQLDTSGGRPLLTVGAAGGSLPANTLVGRPGDFIRVYNRSDASIYAVCRLLRPARTNADGVVTLKLDISPGIQGGRVALAGQDEAVFRVEGGMPRALQPVSGDWTYTWTFREVFADEVGGFQEFPGIWT